MDKFPWWIIGLFVMLAGMSVGWSFSLLIGIIMSVFGIVIMVIYYVMRPKYPVNALVFLKRHGSMRVVADKATRVAHGDGTWYYKLKKMRSTAPAAEYENLYPSGKGEVLILFSPAPGEFYPALFKEKQITAQIPSRDADGNFIRDASGNIVMEEKLIPAIQPVPDNLQQWMVLTAERSRQRYLKKSAWDQYFPIITLAILGIILVIIIQALFQGMAPVVQGFQAAAASNAAVLEKQGEIIEVLTELLQERTIVEPELPGPPPDLG